MKKNYIFPLFFFGAALQLAAQSPITLGNNNMPGSGDTLRYTNIQLGSLGNYQQTGPNFNWDFSTVQSTTDGLRSFKSSLLTPYALFFLSLNEYGEKIQDTIALGPLQITNYYNFYKKSTSPNAFIADGAGATLNGVPLPSYYSDKDEIYNFPMTYPKYDSTTFRFATPATTLIPVRYSKTGYRVTVVDGWGTITTPYGTGNCLRLITTQYSMDSVKTTVGQVTIPLGIANNIRSYQWFTTTSKIPFLEVTGSLIAGVFTPTQARYRGFQQLWTGLDAQNGQDGLQLYPNPVKDRLWLKGGQAADLKAEVFDMQGRLVKKIQVQVAPNGRFMDVSDLQPGVYQLRAGQSGEAAMLRFVKD